MTSTAKNSTRNFLSIGLTVFNILFFFPLLTVAYTAPMGLGGSSHERTALFFVIFSWLSPLSVPIGIYKGWQNIDNPSIKPLLFYHSLPIISFITVITFSMMVAYWLW